jgi:hypothetical protein
MTLFQRRDVIMLIISGAIVCIRPFRLRVSTTVKDGWVLREDDI